jgi:hypothetical protein
MASCFFCFGYKSSRNRTRIKTFCFLSMTHTHDQCINYLCWFYVRGYMLFASVKKENIWLFLFPGAQ